MNSCVKTGCIFKTVGEEKAMNGDLFYEDGEFHLKGVNPTMFETDKWDIITGPILLVSQSKNSTWLKSGPLDVVVASDRFRLHIAEWYPQLLETLP